MGLADLHCTVVQNFLETQEAQFIPCFLIPQQTAICNSPHNYTDVAVPVEMLQLPTSM